VTIKILTTDRVRNGDEPIIREAIEYLERRGIPRGEIRRLEIVAEVDEPITITPTLYVQTERADNPPSTLASYLAETAGEGS
jgi:hypothetical protein